MRFGVPYKGSKNSIAKWIYSQFPVRDNFYDLFAGGCAITQIALMKQEFKPREFLDLIFPKMKIFNAYFFCNKMLIADYLNWANEHDLKYDLLVMNKKNPVPAFKGHHLNDLEYIILIREKGSYFDSKQPFDNYRKFFQISCSGKRLHPAEKPVELLERFVNISCPEGELVFDPFSGSGSTGIACLKSGRNFLGCEKSEEYYELADKRLKDFEDSLNGVGGLFEGII